MTVKTLVYINNEPHWIEKDAISPSRKEGREDLTIDGYISKHGGIFSHADGKVHLSKRSYLDGIKEKGYHIKDYK